MGIKAYHQREERYQGLHLDYSENPERKEDIVNVVESLKVTTGLSPYIYENRSDAYSQSFYIEFHDEYGRECGEFFTTVLEQLHINHCEL